MDEVENVSGIIHPQYMMGCIVGCMCSGMSVIVFGTFPTLQSYAILTPFVMAVIMSIIYLLNWSGK